MYYSSDLTLVCEIRDVPGRAEGERHDRHRRLPATGRHEAAAVADEQVRDVVTAVKAVHDGAARIVTHPARAEEMRCGVLRLDGVRPHLARAGRVHDLH